VWHKVTAYSDRIDLVCSMTWEETLGSAQKTALLQDGRRKVHYTFSDGSELVEEYDHKTCDLLLRKWRKKGALGETKPWDVEVGEVAIAGAKDVGISESVSAPRLVRLDKVDSFQWRIRNLPYPVEIYQITIEGQTIVVRTTNKKYFKRIAIPDMERLGVELDAKQLTYAHANNTLLINYKKPPTVSDFEKRLLAKLKKLKNEGDVDQCKQQ